MNRKRKLLFPGVILFAAYLIFPLAAFCGPSNGTVFPPPGRIEAGYEYHVMFDRELDRSYGKLDTIDHFFALSIGILDWLAIDGKLGIGDVNLRESSHLPKLEFDTGFAGGYGFRIKAFEDAKSRVRLILGMQHICVHPEVRSADSDKYESILDDWQVSGLVSKRFKFLSPYAGIKLSDCEIIYTINKHDRKRRYSENHIGFICGADSHFFEDKVRVNVEGRFFDETGFSVLAAYLF